MKIIKVIGLTEKELVMNSINPNETFGKSITEIKNKLRKRRRNVQTSKITKQMFQNYRIKVQSTIVLTDNSLLRFK
jgi:hypothetical protein